MQFLMFRRVVFTGSIGIGMESNHIALVSAISAILSAPVFAEGGSLNTPVNGQTGVSNIESNASHSEHFYLGARAGWAAYQDACSSNAQECNDDVFAYGLYAGYQFNQWFALEGGFTDYGKPDAKYSNGKVSTDTYGAEVAAKLSYAISPNWEVFTRIGAAYQDIDKQSDWAESEQSQDWNAMASLGLDYSLSHNWSLRGEYQFIDGIGDDIVQGADLHFTSIGLTYHFGEEEVSQPEPVAIPEPRPQTVIEKQVVIKDVSLAADAQFGFNSSILQVSDELNRVVDALNQYPNGSVVITGHTDSVGSEQYNQELSEERAKSVADYFIGKGVDAKRLTVTGAGELEPVASNDTAEGRTLNRRVNIKFETLEEKIDEQVKEVQ